MSILGAGGVGKTSIRQIFTGEKLSIDQEYRATIGSDFSVTDHIYTQEEQSIHLKYMIYDLAGQDRFKSGRANFISGSHAAVLVYDVSNRATLEVIPDWLSEFKSIVRIDVPMVLVANKIDLRDQLGDEAISTGEGRQIAEKIQNNVGFGRNYKIYFVEVSAKENLNINAIFDYISREIYEFYLQDNRLGY